MELCADRTWDSGGEARLHYLVDDVLGVVTHIR